MVDLGGSMGAGGFKPREGGSQNPSYNPQRDIAYLTPHLMQLTTNSFYAEGEASKELRCMVMDMQETGKAANGEDDLQAVMEKFADMVQCIGKKFCQEFMRGQRTFTEALEASGFSKFPEPLRDLWLKHFAHTVLSAFYYGHRDVLMKDQPDILNVDVIFDTAEKMRRHLRGDK